MGNNSSNKDNKSISLKDFQEKETPRKMTIHVLSNNKKDCISLIEYLLGEKFPKNSDEILESQIKKKINLFSFINYKIYNSAETIMKNINEKSNTIYKHPDSPLVFSEVILILNNEKNNEQINIIKNSIKNDDIVSKEKYYIPFIIIISPNNLDLRGLSPSKTFQYKISLENIFSFYRNNQKIEDNKIQEEIIQFLTRINICFSYYNELGDIFSFKNSEGKTVDIIIEEPPNNPAFINVLLLGRSGVGKSTLLNLILDDKKSIEGGTGLSTTSKNIISYRKHSIPIRFFDVKGIENQETVNNYLKILQEHNLNNEGTKDPINAIFYLMKYKTDTVLEDMEKSLFEQLIEFNIPILFIITKTPYDPDQNCKKKIKLSREMERNKIKNVINNIICTSFGKKNRGSEAESFINNYVRFYFVNLLRVESQDLPPFGIDKILSFFSESVSKEDWEKNIKKEEDYLGISNLNDKWIFSVFVDCKGVNGKKKVK